MRKLHILRNVAILSTLIVAGCEGVDSGELPEEASLAVAGPSELKADRPSISFTEISDSIGSVGTTETRKLFTTQTAYKNYFGHKAPSSVNFGTEGVVFYSAGTKNTGGYKASVSLIQLSLTGLTYKVTTALESPGSDCLVTQSITKPYTLVKFKKASPAPVYVSFFKNDVERDCSPHSPCDLVRCAAGTHCEVKVNPCFVAPCPETAVCVADAPTGPFCGGIAGIACPGHGNCVDNPSDGCDPAHGGADCGGVCVCPPNKLACIKGTHWDGSANVCACVADTCVQTQACIKGYHFDNTPGVCACVPDAGACTTDADCRLEDNYCGGCACDALGPGETGTTCSNPVQCFVQPCRGKVAKCENGQCVAAAAPVGIPCGKNTCTGGAVCCNASCGICTLPGNFCIQIECTNN